MAVTVLEKVHGRLQPLVSDGERLEHWAVAQSKQRPSLWLLLALPFILLLGLLLAIFGGQAATAIGLIEPGPMMPVVGFVIAFVIFVPYLYLLVKSMVSRFAVGLTDRRLLVVHLDGGHGHQSGAEIGLGDTASLDYSPGWVPRLSVPTPRGVIKLVFPPNVPGNKQHAVGILERLSRKS